MSNEFMQALLRSALAEPPSSVEHCGDQDETDGSSPDPITHLREEGDRSLEEGDTQKAMVLFEKALSLANVTGRNSLCNQISKDIDYCRVIQWMNDGRKKREEGDVKTAGDMFTSGLALADALVMQGAGLRRPEVIQELYRELDHCQALSLKDEGKRALQANDYQIAIEKYTKALGKAEEAAKEELVLQLLHNRSIVYSKHEHHPPALEDAYTGIRIAPSSFYKGYFRAAQVLKVLENPQEALEVLCDGLARTRPPREFQVDFVMEIIPLAAQLDKFDMLSACRLDAGAWRLVFKSLAKKSRWTQMWQLLDESLANMEDCGLHVGVIDLVKYCSSGSCNTKVWSQKLAIALLKRGSRFPMNECVAFMKRALAFGIETGDFQLLKYIFKNHVTSSADRNQIDGTGESLYRYLTRIYTPGLTNHTIALNLMDNHGIGVCTQHSEGEQVQVHEAKETAQPSKSKEPAHMPKSKETARAQASKSNETAQTPKLKETAQAPKLQETAHMPKLKETAQVSKSSETTHMPMSKEPAQASKSSETEQTSKSKETAHMPNSKETAQASKSNETAQTPKLKKTAQAPKLQETAHMPKLKETAQVSKSSETTHMPMSKETAQASKSSKTTHTPTSKETAHMPKSRETAQAAKTNDPQTKNGATQSMGTVAENGNRKSRKHDDNLQPAVAARPRGGAKTKRNRTKPCKKCCSDYETANKAIDKSTYMHECACKLCIDIINEEGHPLKDHQHWKMKAQHCLLDVVKKRKEVPEGLTSLKAVEYSLFVAGAGKIPDWKLVGLLITAYKNQHGKESIVNLANDIDVEMYLSRPGIQGTKLLNSILEAGGSASTKSKRTGRFPLEIALKNKHWSAIPLLIEYGADADVFSLSEGDTPLHAALQVTMVKDKRGDFQVLNQLLDLHQSDKEKYQVLQPSRQDKAGDTLFHVAAKTQDAQLGLKAATFLFGKGVNPTLQNSDGKTAYQCLAKKSDRRAQVIRVACQAFDDDSVDDKTGSSKKKNRAQGFSRQVSRDPNKIMNQLDERGFGTIVDKPKSKAKGKQRVVVYREDIQNFLKDLDQEELYYIDDDEDDYDDDDDEVEKDSACGLTPGASTELPQVHNSDPAVCSDTSSLKSEVNRITNKEAGAGDASSGINGLGSHTAPSCETICRQDQLSAIHQALVLQENTDCGEVEPEDTSSHRLQDNVPDEYSSEEEDDEVEDLATIDPAIFDDLQWDIECTSDVWNTLYKKNLDQKLRNRICKKIRMLGSGEFDNHRHLKKRLDGVPHGIKLYEAKITKADRLIWEIAIAFSSKQSDPSTIQLTDNQNRHTSSETSTYRPIYTEVIRLWDIVLDHDLIARSVQNIIRSHKKGEECLLQKKLEGIKGKDSRYSDDRKRIPRTFSEVDGGLQPVKKFFPPASAKETEYHIMKWYSFDYLVSSILQNQTEKIDFPFSVTEREYAVINIDQKPPCALLLLGRSGTGKTTCCLYRLWSKFVDYWKRTVADNPLIPRCVKYAREGSEDVDKDAGSNLAEDVTSRLEAEVDIVPEDEVSCDHLHQLFITKNPVLRTEISRNFRYLSHGCPEAKPHVGVEDEPLPHRLQSAHPCAYPLFVTSKQFLVLLDASLPEPNYFPRNEDGALKREVAGWGDDDGPLTFIPDLDNDDLELDDEEATVAAAEELDRSHDPRREVTYEIFAEELWPQMIKKEQDRITCHPSLVWTEICSFIKGSIEALHTKNGCLDLDAYIDLGRKRAPNFPGARDQVFQLFLTYSKLIKRQGMFDEMDLIFNLYSRINKVAFPEWFIHEVYVDETQDFTQAELALLIRCCHDPNQMFLTGDTAQSIMRGIAFRFEDLKSLFYYAKQSNLARGKTNAVEVPETVYQLIHNYRSHAGILNLATSLLDIIDRFFPASYDKEGLEKDRGVFEGPKPVLIDCCSYSDLAMVLCGNKRETSQIEFGAHQAILVVNDEARDNLPEELGFGLVLTIYESKGLEFDDVLLYNFFKDSQAKEEWRVVLQYLDEIIQAQDEVSEKDCKELIEIDMEACSARRRPRPLDFDAEKHKILNSELKHLYTAVTRARVNIWFFDEDEEARKPMFTYFQARKLVRTVEAKGEEDEQRLTELFLKQSSKREWKSRGDDLLRKRLYKIAAECYKNAKRTRLYQLCLANQEALEAKRTDDRHAKREKYLAVSLEYLRCHEYLQAANCLYNAKEYKMAATLYANDKVGKYKDAAKLYMWVKLHDKACEMYELGKAYREAIHLYYDLKKYDKAIDVLRRFQKTVGEYQKDGETIPTKLLKNQPCQAQDACGKCDLYELALKAAQQHRQNGNAEKMMQALDNLDHDVAIRFLTRYSLTKRVAEYHQKHGRHIEAAEIFNRLGDIDRAIECVEACSDESSDQMFCGELKLEKARSLIKHKASEEANELLKSAQRIFVKHEKSLKEAECILLQGMHSATSDETPEKLLFKAYQRFWKADSSIGELECIYQAVKLFPERFTLRECGDAVIRCVDLGLQLATILKYRGTGGQTVKDAETVKTCLRFYGFDALGSDGKSELDIPSNSRISHLIQGDQSTSHESKIIRQDAQKLIVKDIVGEKVKLLCMHARSIAEQDKTTATICPKYKLGFGCSVSLDRCPFKHTPHDPKSFQTLIQSSTLLMQLDSIIAMARQEPRLQVEVKLFRELFSADEGNTSSFDELYRIFYPLDRQEPVLFGGPKVTNSFLEGLQKALAKKHLLWNASFKKDRFVAEDKYAKYWSAEMYFFLHAVYLLVGESGKVRDLLLDAEKDKNPPVYIGFELQNVDKKTRVRLHIFRYILDMLSTLYEEGDPLFAIGHCNQYFYQVAKRGHEKMYPSFAQTMMMFEYKFALTCCMYVKHIGENAFLPKSYLAHIAFFDSVYGGEQELSTFSIMQKYEVDYKAISRLMGGQWSFAKLFCGRQFSKFHMLRDAFCEGSTWLETGEAERVFIFSLALLVNADKAMPNTWRKNRMSLEYMLMKDIASIKLDDDTSCPKRLREAVEATKKAKGLRDVANILTRLLHARGEEELMDCSWPTLSRKRQNFCSVKLERYSLISTSFHRFRPEDAEVPSANEVVVEPHDDETDETAERDTADYAKKVRLQQEEYQVPVPTETEHTPTILEDATIDVDLKIDDTMCSTCGVVFSKDTDQPLKEVEPTRPDDDSKPDNEPNVNLETQISVESLPDYEQQQITREVHELSEAHVQKQAECKEFLQFLKEHVQPLQEEASSIQKEATTSYSAAGEVDIQNLSRRLTVVIGNQREKRDWSDRSKIEQACQTLRDALNVRMKGSALLEPEPEPLSAGSGAGDLVEGPPQLNEGEDAQVPDRPVVEDPVNLTTKLFQMMKKKK